MRIYPRGHLLRGAGQRLDRVARHDRCQHEVGADRQVEFARPKQQGRSNGQQDGFRGVQRHILKVCKLKERMREGTEQ